MHQEVTEKISLNYFRTNEFSKKIWINVWFKSSFNKYKVMKINFLMDRCRFRRFFKSSVLSNTLNMFYSFLDIFIAPISLIFSQMTSWMSFLNVLSNQLQIIFPNDLQMTIINDLPRRRLLKSSALSNTLNMFCFIFETFPCSD